MQQIIETLPKMFGEKQGLDFRVWIDRVSSADVIWSNLISGNYLVRQFSNFNLLMSNLILLLFRYSFTLSNLYFFRVNNTFGLYNIREIQFSLRRAKLK
jgi:hypothetical protein